MIAQQRRVRELRRAMLAGIAMAVIPCLTSANPDVIATLESGVWRSATPPGTPVRQYPLTPAGQVLFDKVRLDQDPSLRCEPPGMPRGFLARSPMVFEFEDDTLTIRYETMDVVRTVHVGAESLHADAPHTRDGHAIAHWDGDALVIMTTHLEAGWMDRNGVPMSDAMTLREVLEIEARDEATYLTVELTITDPEFFSEPYAWPYRFVLEPDWELLPFDCSPTVY